MTSSMQLSEQPEKIMHGTTSYSAIYKIGDLAREFGVTLRTLRFYEDRGLITPERQGTTRLYSEQDRERLRIALFWKRIGLSLGQISSVLELADRSDIDASAQSKIRSVYQKQLDELQERLRETETTISELKTILARV